jgi:hypothetical protein
MLAGFMFAFALIQGRIDTASLDPEHIASILSELTFIKEPLLLFGE